MTEKNEIIIEKLDIGKCIENFKKYILGNEYNPSQKSYVYNNKEDLLSYGIKGNIDSIYLRPLIYKFFLNHLPIDKNLQQWISIIFNNRVSYLQLKTKYFPLEKSNKITGNEKKNDNNESDTKRKEEENDEEIKNLIELDLSRTFQEISLFKDPNILKVLFNVLYIYNKEKFSYKQGMNEIISILFLSIYPYYFPCKKNITRIDLINAINLYNKRSKVVLNKSMNYKKNNNMKGYIPQVINNKEAVDTLFNFFHDEKFIEVDLYYLFNDLMDKGFNIFFKDESLQKRCDNIMSTKLKMIDSDLYNHCTNINLPHQIFLGKWIQTFFDQLTNVNNCISILDIIISQEYLHNNMNKEINIIKKNDIYEFEYLDCICLAMIKKYKEELLKKNGDQFLIFCLCYPAIQNFNEIIQSANFINLTLNKNNLEITSINNNLDNNSSLKCTQKKRIYYGKIIKHRLTKKTNTLNLSESNPKLYTTKKIKASKTIIDKNNKSTYNENNNSPMNNIVQSEKATKSSNLIEIKNVKLRNKENSNNNKVKTSESIKIGSFLHQFDEYDLIDTYYF